MKNNAGDRRNEGFGVLGCLIVDIPSVWVFRGIGVDGKKPFFTVPMLSYGPLVVGDVNE